MFLPAPKITVCITSKSTLENKVQINKNEIEVQINNQSGYDQEPLNLENGSFVNSYNFDATDFRL